MRKVDVQSFNVITNMGPLGPLGYYVNISCLCQNQVMVYVGSAEPENSEKCKCGRGIVVHKHAHFIYVTAIEYDSNEAVARNRLNDRWIDLLEE